MSYLIDILGIAGAALLVTGATLIYMPAGFVVAGILCLAGAIIGAKRIQEPS